MKDLDFNIKEDSSNVNTQIIKETIEEEQGKVTTAQSNIVTAQSDIQTLKDIANSRVSVYLSASQTIPSGVLTKVQFNTKDYDNLSEWDSTNYKFIAKKKGYYDVSTQISWQNAIAANNQTQIRLLKNGNSVAFGHFQFANAVNYTFRLIKDIYCDVNDFLEVWLYQATGVGVPIHSNFYFCYCTIHRFA